MVDFSGDLQGRGGRSMPIELHFPRRFRFCRGDSPENLPILKLALTMAGAKTAGWPRQFLPGERIPKSVGNSVLHFLGKMRD